jgi:Fur family ferric uptake transcriptional regulator
MKSKDQSVTGLLREKKLRVTPIRRALLEKLAKTEQPLSIEELFAELSRTGKAKGLDLATLYRNVKSFEEAGLIAAIDLGTGRSFYEFRHGGDSHHHHHVICENCRKIEHLDVCGIEAHLRMLEKMGYKQVRHKLEFSGLCKACA